ncbi:MAG TPA: peptidyl-prolyl cis-trans isomerase [Nitrospiria bacterium]|nr:peptidyl-prolyl cis-trans isomerase [Nitrospiria bacterium]
MYILNNRLGLPCKLSVLVMAAQLFLAPISSVKAMTIERIVAIVNNEIITLSEVNEEVLFARLGIEDSRTGGVEGSRGPLASGSLDPLDPFTRERLKKMIDKRLQLQIARKAGISVSQEDIKGVIEDIKRKNSIASDKEFIGTLEEEHLTLEMYTAQIRDQLILMKLINREVRSKIVVRGEDLRDYYNNHRALFAFPSEIKISQILIPLPKAAPETIVEDLRKKASGMVEEIRAGGDFFVTAKRYKGIIDGIVAADLGFFKKGDLMPSLEKTADSLKSGEISYPIETQAGIHIIRLDERGSVRYKPFEAALKEIEEAVYQEKNDEALAVWLKDIRDGAHVDMRF